VGHDRRPDATEEHGGDAERDADPGEHHHQTDVPDAADRIDVRDAEQHPLETDRCHDREAAAKAA